MLCKGVFDRFVLDNNFVSVPNREAGEHWYRFVLTTASDVDFSFAAKPHDVAQWEQVASGHFGHIGYRATIGDVALVNRYVEDVWLKAPYLGRRDANPASVQQDRILIDLPRVIAVSHKEDILLIWASEPDPTE